VIPLSETTDRGKHDDSPIAMKQHSSSRSSSSLLRTVLRLHRSKRALLAVLLIALTATAPVAGAVSVFPATATTSDGPATPDASASVVGVASTTSPSLEILTVDVADTANPGETLEFEVEIYNSGSSDASDVGVEYTVNGTRVGEATIDVPAGRVVRKGFTYTPDETGTVGHSVEVNWSGPTLNAAVTTDVRLKPADFRVRSLSAPDIIGEYDRTDFAATIVNEGDTEQEQIVKLLADGSRRDATFLELNPGEKEEVSFPGIELTAGDYTLSVSTENDTKSQSLEVLEEGTSAFDGRDISAPDSVDPGEPLVVDVLVANPGDSGTTQDVTVWLDTTDNGRIDDGEPLDTRSLSLGGKDSTYVTYELSTEEVSIGGYQYRVRTEDDIESGVVSVTRSDDPPTADAGSDETVTPGSTVTLDASGSSDPDGDPLSFSWTQTGGPSVDLAGEETATPEFTAPEVDSATTLTFDLTVSDGRETDTDTVSVTVEPSDREGDVTVDRRFETDSVKPGDTFRVTLEAEFSTAHDRTSIIDAYRGPIEDVTLESVSIDGIALDPIANAVTNDDLTVAVGGVPADAPIRVVYTVTVAENAESGDSIRFTGSLDNPDVTTGDVTAEFGTGTVTVTDDEGGSGGSASQVRTVSRERVTSGETFDVTLSATFAEAHDEVVFLDGYDGPVEDATIRSIRVDGRSVASRWLLNVGPGGVTVGVRDVAAGATVNVTYSITAAETVPGTEEIRFIGSDGSADIVAGERTAEFGSNSTTVEGEAGTISRERTLSTSELSPGDTLEVTLSTDFSTPHEAVFVRDGYSGPVDDTTIESIRIDGVAVTSTTPVSIDERSLTVALKDLSADANVTVVYSLTVSGGAGPEGMVRFTGSDDAPDVSAGELSGDFGTANATVVMESDPVDRADGDDNDNIDDEELQTAVIDWAAGEYSDAAVQSIIRAWASSS
jgi:hypothetical protein